MTQNKHLDHVEDLIFLKSPQEALWWLKEGLNFILQSRHSHLEFSIKWDGAPAFVVGTNFWTEKFFVGTKSVFNKNPKIAYTPEDVDHHYGINPLGDKLKLLFSNKAFVPEGRIFQGDFLYGYFNLMFNDGLGFNFQPNTLKYAFDESPLPPVGVAIHTEYVRGLNDDFQSLRSQYHIDDGKFGNDSIKVFNCGVDRKIIEQPFHKLANLQISYQHLEKLILGIDFQMLKFFNANPGVVEVLSLYINHCVREVEIPSGANFLSYVTKHYMVLAERLKTLKGKNNKGKELSLILENLLVPDLDFMFLVHILMQNLKDNIIKKIDENNKTEVSIYHVNGTENVPTTHEGYVATSRASYYLNAVKFVNRSNFSRLNMISPKIWQ